MSLALVSYPWQQAQWQNLQNLIEQARLPHALLLTGPEGIGKRRFAQAFAARLLCSHPQAGLACGKCQNCRWCSDGQHPDFIELTFPEGKRQISVDQVRELAAFTTQRAHCEQGRKVVLIQPAEGMTINAANALLKTLEEPPGQTLLILVSDMPSRLLATIRSRCLRFDFATPEPASCQQWLQQQVGSIADVARLMAEAQGRPLSAVAMYESDALTRYGQLDALLASVISGEVVAIAAAEQIANEELESILGWWSRRLQMLIKMRCGVPVTLPQPWSTLQQLAVEALFPRLEEVQRYLDQLNRGVGLNRRLLLERILLDWRNLCQNSKKRVTGHGASTLLENF